MHNKISAFCVKVIDRMMSYSIYNTFGSINRARGKTAALLAGAFIFANTITFAAPATVDVTIVDNGNEIKIITTYATVEEVLQEQGISIGQYDMVSPEIDEIIANNQVIVIDRVKKVTVNDGGVTSEYYTTGSTLSDLFAENNIVIGSLDSLDKPVETILDENTDVNITRVVKTTVSVDEPIPFKTVAVESAGLLEGTVKVTSQGEEGVLTKKYEVYLSNGVELSRTEILSEVTKKPVDKVISIGTRPKQGNPPEKYSRVITCSATAYDLSFQSCGKYPGDKGYGITATGTQAKYGTVAVDPSVIPLGSKLYIETSDGSFVYGYATAEDTGGAIKGNKVDLFFPSYDDCMNFGRRNVTVYIIE